MTQPSRRPSVGRAAEPTSTDGLRVKGSRPRDRPGDAALVEPTLAEAPFADPRFADPPDPPDPTAADPALAEVARAKQDVRDRTWSLLEQERVARFPGARGRIPNFAGAEQAAERLASLPEWAGARVVKSNPDAPQLPVRARALAAGKLLAMAVPRLADPRPFVLLDRDRLRTTPRRAVSIGSAVREGRPVTVEELPPVDLVVCGSVAVNAEGVRIGKGGGFSDLEFGLFV